jgi:RND superfamily putative drug exporter
MPRNAPAPRNPDGSHRAAGTEPRQSPAGKSGGRSGWARFLIPVVLIIVWFAVGGIGGPYFGKISEVADNNQTSYLPASSASTQVADLQQKFTDSDAIPAVVVYVNNAGLTEEDRAFVTGRVSELSKVSGVAGDVSPPQFSTDGKAAEIFVPVQDNGSATATVEDLGNEVRDGIPQGLESYVTGPAGQLADITEAFGGIDTSLVLVAALAVLVILVVVYRSPLLPFLVLLTSIFALSAAILVVFYLAKAGTLTLNGQVQGILFILGIGAATDYSLLYVSRYRESLRDHEGRWDATWAALKGTFEPVLASALPLREGGLLAAPARIRVQASGPGRELTQRVLAPRGPDRQGTSAPHLGDSHTGAPGRGHRPAAAAGLRGAAERLCAGADRHQGRPAGPG